MLKLFKLRFTLASMLAFSSALASFCLPSPEARAGWQLTFADEFSGTALNLNKWIPTDGWGNRGYPAQGELECYMPNNFSAAGGILSIVARREYNPNCYPTNPNPTHYTSGMISTAKSFQQQYGYFEIRAKLPKGNGFWPAFWLLPADKTITAEIDVLESIGAKVNSIFQALHYHQGAQYLSSAGYFAGPDFSAGFHTVGVDWQPGVLTFYGDGVATYVARTSGVPNKPMYLIANLAVGGKWPGNPDASTVFPSALQVDYIRAYQRVNNGQPDAIPPFGMTGGGGGGGTPTTISLVQSNSADRSGPVPLSGSVSGNIYIFVPDVGGIARVDFSVDGGLFHSESLAPWDFNGSAASGGAALPFNTGSLGSGTHTISAKATMSNGAVQTANTTVSIGSSVSASGILLSYASDRSNAVDLNGHGVSGNIYVFVPSSGIAQTRFLIDGALVKIENNAPFDLAGTSTNGTSALAFNASGLSPGTHTIQAQLTLSSGSTKTASATVYH